MGHQRAVHERLARPHERARVDAKMFAVGDEVFAFDAAFAAHDDRAFSAALLAQQFHDAVDLANDLFDDGGRGFSARLLKEFRQGGLGLPPLIFRFDALFGLHGFLRNGEQLLEVFEAGDEALLQPFFDLLQALPQRDEDRIVAMLPQARDDLDFQFFRFLLVGKNSLDETDYFFRICLHTSL